MLVLRALYFHSCQMKESVSTAASGSEAGIQKVESYLAKRSLLAFQALSTYRVVKQAGLGAILPNPLVLCFP